MSTDNPGGRCKQMTERNVAIRAARAAGDTFDKIAADFGISKSRAIQLCNPEKLKEHDHKNYLKRRAKMLAKEAGE